VIVVMVVASAGDFHGRLVIVSWYVVPILTTFASQSLQ